MTQVISATGLVATDPQLKTTSKDDSVVSFRLAATGRRFNQDEGKWESTATNWYTVICFRKLADHVSQSIAKGDRVLVRGKIRVRDWDNGERSGTAVEIDAESIGHDLLFGTTTFNRIVNVPDPDELEEEDLEAELQPA